MLNLFLTEQESKQLDDLCEKYPYAQLLWNITIPVKDRAGKEKVGEFRVGMGDAWEWKSEVDKERKGFLPLCRDSLRRKLISFYEKIG